jgi:hypothetical protein
MDNIHKYLLSAIFAIVLFPMGLIVVGLISGEINFMNYYIDSSFLTWIYSLFVFRDGLYEEYALLPYLLSYCITIFIIKKMFDIFLVVFKKT